MRKLTKIICLIIVLVFAFEGAASASGFARRKKEPEIRAESVTAYDNAHKLYESGKYTNAAKAYQEYMKSFPDSELNVAALYYTAECYRETKDKDKALSFYNQVVSQYKDGFWSERAKERITEIGRGV